jgi:hypothetical protein
MRKSLGRCPSISTSIQEAAYVVYVQLTPANKKPISQREFYSRFRDIWELFGRIERDEYGEVDGSFRP